MSLKSARHGKIKHPFEGWVNSDSFRQAHAHRGGQQQGADGQQTESVMLGSQLSTHRVLVARRVRKLIEVDKPLALLSTVDNGSVFLLISNKRLWGYVDDLWIMLISCW